jgi:16S rRNA C967 or C1407 C5-methylase (RsmB/RsmF family)/NOL1/NOP2/fmu family ribosome biogenesis protein
MLEELLQAALVSIPLGAGELQQIAFSLQQFPARSIRRVERCGTGQGDFFAGLEKVRWHRNGFWWDESRGRPGGEPLYAAGGYFIQDAASMLPLTLLNAQPGEIVCDLCAAPGGKATAIAESLADSGWLLANETIQSRLAPLELNLARSGSDRYVTSNCDPEFLAQQLADQFDALLVDAPCSGQTLIGKGKQSFASMNAASIEMNAARQVRILDAAARLVRPGGRLVYSTCTLATAENEHQVEAFLQRHRDWEAVPYESWLQHSSEGSENGAEILHELRSPLLTGCYRLWPHRDRCAGGFAALLQRKRFSEEAVALPESLPAERKSHAKLSPRVANRSRFQLKAWNSEIPAELSQWGESRFAAVVSSAQQAFAWPEEPPTGWLDLMHGGPEIAYRKGSQWFPAHALALRSDWKPHRFVELTAEQTKRVMAGESLPKDDRLAAESANWCVARWQGLPLGWLKFVGTTGKNHIPKSARLHLQS